LCALKKLVKTKTKNTRNSTTSNRNNTFALALLSVMFIMARALPNTKKADMVMVEINTPTLSSQDEAFYANFLEDEFVRTTTNTSTTRRLESSSSSSSSSLRGDSGDGSECELQICSTSACCTKCRSTNTLTHSLTHMV
jgi:hypothetical protein